MNSFLKQTFVIAGSLLVVSVGNSVVKAPEVRQEKIDLAIKILSKEPILLDEKLIASAGNPFEVEQKPAIVLEEIEEVAAEEISAAELMPLLAESVNPTGIFAIGGEYYLMFKEDKVKSGGVIPVMHKGKEYDLEISHVLRNGYSLRFQDAELEVKLK